MRAEDITDTLVIVLAASNCGSAKVLHKPRLLSDNGSFYIAGNLAEYLENKGVKHVRDAPMHLLLGRRLRSNLPRGLRPKAKSSAGTEP